MLKRILVTAACGGALSTPLYAQSLNIASPSLDVAVAPQYPASVPNSGQPIQSVRTVTGFGNVYGFGSSSSNTLLTQSLGLGAPYTEYFTNGHAIYTEILSPLIGASYTPGNTFPGATGLANGGATTTSLLYGRPVGCTINVNCTLNPEIQQFQQVYGHFNPNDVAVHWGAVNDWNSTPITSVAVEQQVAATAIAQETLAIQQLVGLGARNVVFVGLSDLGDLLLYNTVSPNASALLTQGSRDTNAGAISNLITIHNQTGANIHYFDQALMVNEIRANPLAYGYSVAGVQPNASCTTLIPFNTNTACGKSSYAVQNQTLSLDGLHWTERFHDIQGQAIANQLIAPFTMAPEGEVAVAGAQAFASHLFRRLDAQRLQAAATRELADLPEAAPAAPVRRVVNAPVALFAEGGYAGGNRSNQFGGAGFSFDLANLTVGAEVQVTPDLLVGFAFDYSQPNLSVTSLGTIGITHFKDDAYHFGAYGSYSRPNYFANVVLGYGLDTFDVSRNGIIDQLRSHPNSNTFIAAGQGAYLFDAGRFKVGPLGSIVYSRVGVGSYAENGDPLLTQFVNRQDFGATTGGAGIEVTTTFLAFNRLVAPYLNLTAEHDFSGTQHLLTTAQTYLTSLPINTPIGYAPDRAYGLAEGGVKLDLGGGASFDVTGGGSFARTLGNYYAANGSFRYRF